MGAQDQMPTQHTPIGHEIPVPKKGEFFDNLKKASKLSPPEKESDADARRRTSENCAFPSREALARLEVTVSIRNLERGASALCSLRQHLPYSVATRLRGMRGEEVTFDHTRLRIRIRKSDPDVIGPQQTLYPLILPAELRIRIPPRGEIS
jgi:hypothetical protein